MHGNRQFRNRLKSHTHTQNRDIKNKTMNRLDI